MQGRRVYCDNQGGYFTDLAQTAGAQAGPSPGDYWHHLDQWWAMTPNGYHCNLRRHTVAEHEDGSITVSPSILIRTGDNEEAWHGFLERGVWRHWPRR